MSARVLAFRRAARVDPSELRMCRERRMVECGKRWVNIACVKVEVRVVAISLMRL
jgi:hypothetical protein